MTALAAPALPAPARFDRTGARRAAIWLACLALVLALHVAAFLHWDRPIKPEGETVPEPAMLIDLAPAAEPPAPATAAPEPEPAKPVTQPPPPQPPPQPEPPQPPQPEPPQLQPPEPPTPAPPEPTPPDPIPSEPLPTPVPTPVPMPLPAIPEPPAPVPPPPRPAPRHVARPPRPVPPRHVEAAPTAPPVVAPPIATPAPVGIAPPAPAPAARPAAAAPAGSAAPSWERALLAQIARFKRYPPDAERRGWQGVAVLRFVMRRDGSLVSVALARGSGHEALDEAATDSLRRAAPLPAPPATVPGETITLELPLRFALDEH